MRWSVKRGPGADCQVVAMGYPDELHWMDPWLVWAAGDAILVMGEQSGWIECLNQVLAFGSTRSGAMVVYALPSGAWSLSRVVPEIGLQPVCLLPSGADRAWVGEGHVLVRESGRYRLLEVETGTDVVAPIGARSAHSRPLADQPGVMWWDELTLYQWKPGKRATAVGQMEMPIEGLWPQPDGRVVVEMVDDVVVLETPEMQPGEENPGMVQLGPIEARAWLDLQQGTLVASDGVRMRGLQEDALPEDLEACCADENISPLLQAVDAELFQDALGGHWVVGEDGLVIHFNPKSPSPR